MLDDYSILYQTDYDYPHERESLKDQALVRINKASSAVSRGAKRAAPVALPALGVAAAAGLGFLLFAPQTKDARENVKEAVKTAAHKGKQAVGEALNTVDNFESNYPEVYRSLLDVIPGGKPVGIGMKARKFLRKFM